MSRFSLTSLPLQGLMCVQRQRLVDQRGFLSRLFCADELLGIGWSGEIMQVNHTQTVLKGTVRGLHYQLAPYAETKLVTCVRGVIWDVAIDLRAGSPTFLRWHGQTLSAENLCAMVIPEGFAHGFQTLTDDCELIYLHSRVYAPEVEAGLNPLDTAIGIEWPLAITVRSARDASHPWLDEKFKGLTL